MPMSLFCQQNLSVLVISLILLVVLILLLVLVVLVVLIVLVVLVVLILLIVSVVIHCFHLPMSELLNPLVQVVHSEYSLSHLRKTIHRFEPIS